MNAATDAKSRLGQTFPVVLPENDPTGIGRGLFDFHDYEALIAEIAAVVDLDPGEINRRLFCEALRTGWNVSESAATFGLIPHEYSERMEEFYRQTSAFVLELATIHCDRGCQEIDGLIAEEILKRFPDRSGVRILALGDGIGTDSLRLALGGYEVTYFEFEGASANFALRRFHRQKVNERITRIHDLAAIPELAFEVVICREVLEHVPNPTAVIDNMWRYLRRSGVAIVTESFARVEPQFPTHLRSNLVYAGRTLEMFKSSGFRVAEIHPGGRPMVFAKVSRSRIGRALEEYLERMAVLAERTASRIRSLKPL